ncbi:hypothetical protein PPYR_03901, partial [Photinus pyralis]
VNEPVEWVSNLVIIQKKDNSLRICLDPQDLNVALHRENVLIPTIEDISHKLCNKKVYT